MEVTTNYISCACNYYPHAVDWGKNRLICYASSHSVIIYDPYAGRGPGPAIGRVLKTLDKHLTPVKSVQWIKTVGVEPETEIISGSLDGTIVVWTKNEHDSFEVNCTIETKDHLILTQAYYINGSDDKSLLICGAFSHDSISIWRRDTTGDIIDKQDVDLKDKFPINIQFFHLPTSSSSNIPALIVTTDDNMINLFAWSNDSHASPINFVHMKELKGHQDWIQALDVIQINEKESFIASGSQDGMIRLWKCSLNESEELLDEMTTQFSLGNYHFNVSLESVFRGHGDWVYGLHWHPPLLDENGKIYKPLKLLSCGFGKTVVIWKEGVARAWVESVKLGNVGGNAAGYYGCRFNEDGSSVLAYGYQGSFHIWEMTKEKNWIPRSAPSGHFSEVNDLAWESQGRYLVTSSLDQTTRIHVPWKESSADDQIWHEISRPQIHGYDINVIAILSATRFASGADEKVVRIFEAPTHFIEALNTGDWRDFKKIKDRTSVPALGLTNKVVDNEEMLNKVDNDDINPEIPPTEDEMTQYTLWPELEKLYGHGYEIFAMAATHDGKFLATSCKSNSQEHSAIIIWNMTTFSQVQQLICHRLTVTQLEFSRDDKYLVSVSRDRGWGLYHRSDEASDNLVNYKLVARNSRANSLHSRIIWCCSWTHDSKYFATGSRDGRIGFWSADELQKNSDKGPKSNLEMKNASVTALAFSKEFLAPNTYILAIGYDDGVIEIQKIIDSDSEVEFVSCGKLEKSRGHHKTVKRLAFRPHKGSETLQLASCSADWTVKIYTLYSENLKKITN